jgi:phosphatidylserine decarboxylase
MKVAKESLPIAAVLGLAALAAGLLMHPLATIPPLLLLLFTLWFFRDPEREAPPGSGLIVSPADGKIIKAGAGKVSVFMNVFNVHICRSPIAGAVLSVEHLPGRFLAAFRDEAPEQNERAALLIADGDLRLRCTLIAGLIARRIVVRVSQGSRLARGERLGLIQFGSRVVVDLPPGCEPAVSIGQMVSAGVTVIARLPGPPERGD